MSDIPRPLPLSKQWQFPLLLASAALFASGFWRYVPRPAPPTPSDKLAELNARLHAGDWSAAHDQALQMLAAPLLTDHERGAILAILARAIHGAERGAAVHAADNARRIIESFQTAGRLGVTPEPADLLRIGDAHAWLDHAALAVETYIHAIDAGAAPVSPLRRRVLAWLDEMPAPDARLIDSQMQALLADARTEPTDLLWAFGRKLDSCLAAGALQDAHGLIDLVAARLNQAGDGPEIEFARARLLAAGNHPDEADRLLRELRSTGPRDDLWARAGQLLARIQDADGRGEAALALYDEIQDAFPGGLRFLEAQQGRQDALAGLRRYEEALSATEVLVDIALGRDSPNAAQRAAPVDRDILRAGLLSLAELLRGDGQAELGLTAVRLASRLADPDDAPQQLALLRMRAALAAALAASLPRQTPRAAEARVADERLADERLADSRQRPKVRGEQGPQSRRRRELYEEAAEASFAASQISTPSATESSDDLWRAIDSFEAAGAMDRAARLLERFIEEQPTEPRRVTAMLRLGRVRQADADYAGAIAAYARLLREYPRTPDSLAAMVPYATCLLARGGDDAGRGEALLMQMVEDRSGSEPLCDPTAPEYADALFRLTELHYDQRRSEDVIFRANTFLALRPGDPRAPAARFLLADSFRRSAQALIDESGRTSDLEQRERMRAEGVERLSRAERLFAAVTADGGNDAERLKAAWLYRADCLFDRGLYADALEAYAEAAWRYDNEMTAVSALMQVVHCQQRLGRATEAQSALARLAILVRKMPESAFAGAAGAPGKEYWISTVDRLETMRPL